MKARGEAKWIVRETKNRRFQKAAAAVEEEGIASTHRGCMCAHTHTHTITIYGKHSPYS